MQKAWAAPSNFLYAVPSEGMKIWGGGGTQQIRAWIFWKINSHVPLKLRKKSGATLQKFNSWFIKLPSAKWLFFVNCKFHREVLENCSAFICLCFSSKKKQIEVTLRSFGTGKFLSKAFMLTSTNPQYGKRLFIDVPV